MSRSSERLCVLIYCHLGHFGYSVLNMRNFIRVLEVGDKIPFPGLNIKFKFLGKNDKNISKLFSLTEAWKLN